jgi:hypothetical protein
VSGWQRTRGNSLQGKVGNVTNGRPQIAVTSLGQAVVRSLLPRSHTCAHGQPHSLPYHRWFGIIILPIVSFVDGAVTIMFFLRLFLRRFRKVTISSKSQYMFRKSRCIFGKSHCILRKSHSAFKKSHSMLQKVILRSKKSFYVQKSHSTFKKVILCYKKSFYIQKSHSMLQKVILHYRKSFYVQKSHSSWE